MAYALKLDRSFVAGLGRSKEDTAIVTATLALAKALDMRVVAEGVETLSQLNILSELQCDYAQGYAFSRPLPMEKVLDLWLDTHLQAVDC
jgi:EAL domain-containing protein (putative c-di-GMP-specific phosphodiesterase class I)